jgi:hypothetical protein
MEPGNMEQIFLCLKWLWGTDINFDGGYDHFYTHMLTQSPDKINFL